MADENYSVINKTAAQINELLTKADTAITNIGTLNSLTTDTKTALVPAINEVDANADGANVKAGHIEGVMAENASRDFYGIPTMGGQPMVLFCSAKTPAEATVPDNWKQFDPETEEGYNWDGTPTLIGQRYIYTPASGDGAEYVAVRASASSYTLRWMKV